MVLDDAAARESTSDFFDPYVGQPDPHPTIDLRKLPRPIPILGRVFGFNDERLSRYITGSSNNFVEHLHRPPTNEEFDAIAYYVAKGFAIASWGPPLGLLAGGSRCWSTRKSYKFPFLKAQEGFDGTTVRLGNTQLLAGNNAKLFWHTARFSLYGTIGTMVVGFAIGGYAATVAAVGEISDPRLKTLMEAIRSERREEQINKGVRPRRGDPTGQGTIPASDLWKNHRTAIGAREVGDGSPTTDQDMDFVASQETESKLYGDDIGVRDRSEVAASQQSSSEPRRGPAWNRSAVAKSAESDESQGGAFYEGYDNTSPSRSSGGTTTGTNKPGSGSVWERLRRDAAATASGPNNTRPGPGRSSQQRPSAVDSADGDTYSFSNSDEERSFAREQAQRDFDAQLDRERQGEEFSGNGREKKW
ncbi:hypothetical protein MMC19_007452 [Ptychographa xylographoides]|nr:hypothetical protein [Ptychographa xylographoides]